MKIKKNRIMKIIVLMLFILVVTSMSNNMFIYMVNAGEVEKETVKLEYDMELDVEFEIIDGSGMPLELSKRNYNFNFEEAKKLRFVISIDMPEYGYIAAVDSQGKKTDAAKNLDFCPRFMYNTIGDVTRSFVPVSVSGDESETYVFTYRLDEKEFEGCNEKIDTFKLNLNYCKDNIYGLQLCLNAAGGGLFKFEEKVVVFDTGEIYIDDITPTATINSVNNLDGSVTVTVIFDEENVTITNNSGKNTYTFTENGEFTFTFKDKAGNEGSVTATTTDVEIKEPKVEFKTLKTIEEAGKVYVKVDPKATVESIKSDIDTEALAGKTVEIENLTEDGKIKTGSIITIDGEVQCIIVLRGDLDGDGKIDFIEDIIRANNYRLKLIDLEVEQKLASDIDGDGIVDFIKDLIKINNYRLGLIDLL